MTKVEALDPDEMAEELERDDDADFNPEDEGNDVEDEDDGGAEPALLPSQPRDKPFFHCFRCLNTYRRKRCLRDHWARNVCLHWNSGNCSLDHVHQPIRAHFETRQEAVDWIRENELDAYFSTASTREQSKVLMCSMSNRGRKKEREYKLKTKKVADCYAGMKITAVRHCACEVKPKDANDIYCKGQINRYELLGCLAHSHELDPKMVRLSFKTRNHILNLLLQGKGVHETVRLCREDPTVCGPGKRLVSVSDVVAIDHKHIKRERLSGADRMGPALAARKIKSLQKKKAKGKLEPHEENQLIQLQQQQQQGYSASYQPVQVSLNYAQGQQQQIQNQTMNMVKIHQVEGFSRPQHHQQVQAQPVTRQPMQIKTETLDATVLQNLAGIKRKIQEIETFIHHSNASLADKRDFSKQAFDSLQNLQVPSTLKKVDRWESRKQLRPVYEQSKDTPHKNKGKSRKGLQEVQRQQQQEQQEVTHTVVVTQPQQIVHHGGDMPDLLD